MKGSSMQTVLSTSAFRLGRPRVCSQCSQCRHFSLTASRAALGQERAQQSRKGQQAQQSMKSRMKDVKTSQIPTDFGLVGENKMFPSLYASLPLLFTSPQKFYKLILRRVKTSAAGYVSLYTTLGGVRKRNPHTGKWQSREKFLMNQRPQLAKDLHKRLNTAIPLADTDAIHHIACKGLDEKIRTRVQVRKQSHMPQESWELVKYNGISLPRWFPWWMAKLVPFKAATVISDYAYPFPLYPRSYIRQVIVRIKSKQQYDKGDGTGVKQKTLTEYVAIQRMVLDTEEREWMIWGTIEPKTIKDIDDILKDKDEDDTTRDLGFMEKMQMRFAGGRGLPSPGP